MLFGLDQDLADGRWYYSRYIYVVHPRGHPTLRIVPELGMTRPELWVSHIINKLKSSFANSQEKESCQHKEQQ